MDFDKAIEMLEEVADIADSIMHEAESTEECLPPHPSYIVDGDLIRKLIDWLNRYMDCE